MSFDLDNLIPDFVDYQQKLEERIEKWDRRFLDIAKIVSTWSKDPSSKIGAVLVDKENRILSVGYNGFPRGVEDTEERYNNRPLKYEMVVHAEANAILAAGERARDSTLYVYPGWRRPCMCAGCAKTAIQAGVQRVVGLVREVDKERLSRWKESLDIAQEMCDEVGILTEEVHEH